jgi:hypothetical protein
LQLLRLNPAEGRRNAVPTNLDKFLQETSGLSSVEKYKFDIAMLGALSVHVASEIWERCMRSAYFTVVLNNGGEHNADNR